MIRILYRRLRRLFWSIDPRPAEVMSATTAILWGIGIVWSGDTFWHSAYHHLFGFAPDWLWATWLIFLGGIQSWFVVWGTSRETIRHEIVTGASAATWAIIAGSLTAVAPSDPAALGYWAIGASSLWSFVRSGICEQLESKSIRGDDNG